jgi:hypothetical protein
MAPYHPAYKIAPTIGRSPLPDADKAASPVYSLVVRSFPGVSADELASKIAALGGTVTLREDSKWGATVFTDLLNTKIFDLARITDVRLIDENLPQLRSGEENSWNVIAGTYIIGQKPPLYLAGVDGSGKYLKDVDNAPTSNVIGVRPAGPEDIDWNGNGVLDNAAQVIADTDTGMDVDAGDFSETAFSSGWNGNGGNAGPNVPRYGDGLTNLNHRKVAWYEVAPGGFGNGDLRTCDPFGSHGQVTAAQAAGNASSGPFLADGIDWNGDGTVDDYGDPDPGDPCGPGSASHRAECSTASMGSPTAPGSSFRTSTAVRTPAPSRSRSLPAASRRSWGMPAARAPASTRTRSAGAEPSALPRPTMRLPPPSTDS